MLDAACVPVSPVRFVSVVVAFSQSRGGHRERLHGRSRSSRGGLERCPTRRLYARGVADLDEPRFLAPVSGYVPSSARAIDPLEAVPSAYQRELSQRARLDELRRTQEAWGRAEVIVGDAIAAFEQVADPRLRPGLRGLQKAARRLGHMVDRLEPLDDE